MLSGNAGMTPADLAAITGNGNGFGDGNSWWIILFILILFGGWGNSGWGNGNSGAADNYVLTSDFSQLSRQLSDATAMTERKLDSVTNGICSLGYDQLAQMNGINTNILTTGNSINSAISGIGSQLQNCCCTTQRAIDGVNYNLATQEAGITNAVNTGFADVAYRMATDTCAINTNASNNTRDIVDSQNAGTQAILNKLSQMESNAKDERIAELTALNSDLRLAASQQAQNNYLVSTLRPSPSPAYVVSNPYCCCGYVNGTTIA